jgi:plasmid stabilization system protein ParE
VTHIAYSPEALSDFAAIRMAILRSTKSEREVRVKLNRIDTRCESLGVFPQLGQARPEISGRMRSFPIFPNVVFYVYDQLQDAVYIARILDGRRDLGTLFADFDEPAFVSQLHEQASRN